MAAVKGGVGSCKDLVIDDVTRLVRNFPLWNVKRGDNFWVLLSFRDLAMAYTGHVEVPVFLVRMTADWRYWSDLDAFMLIFIELLFNVISRR